MCESLGLCPDFLAWIIVESWEATACPPPIAIMRTILDVKRRRWLLDHQRGSMGRITAVSRRSFYVMMGVGGKGMFKVVVHGTIGHDHLWAPTPIVIRKPRGNKPASFLTKPFPRAGSRLLLISVFPPTTKPLLDNFLGHTCQPKTLQKCHPRSNKLRAPAPK